MTPAYVHLCHVASTLVWSDSCSTGDSKSAQGFLHGPVLFSVPAFHLAYDSTVLHAEGEPAMRDVMACLREKSTKNASASGHHTHVTTTQSCIRHRSGNRTSANMWFCIAHIDFASNHVVHKLFRTSHAARLHRLAAPGPGHRTASDRLQLRVAIQRPHPGVW